MKKLLLALPLIALCACGGKKDKVCDVVQPTTVKVSIVDKDASRWFHSIVWDSEANSLNTKTLADVERTESGAPYTDSLVLYSCVRSVAELHPSNQGVSIDLGTPRYYTLHQNPSYTARRVAYDIVVDPGIHFTAPWYVEYEGEERKSVEHLQFYLVGDTIYTLNYPEVIGFTPEGLSFQISGDDIADVKASYSLNYDVYVADELYARSENWAFVCRLATEEYPLEVADDGTYILPVVGAVEVTDTDWRTMGEMRTKAIDEWQDFSRGTMTKADYLFDFDCYKVVLDVTRKDGTVCRYLHLATALYIEP